MGMGGGVISQAFAQAMNPSGYVNPSMFNAYSPQPSTPYQPAGSGYGAAPTSGATSAGGDLAGRYEIRKMAQGGLAAAADHIASKGRGEDTTLVHMTPGEVKGLQDLAMAHGGSLTINPDTGLVEAGWLKNLLPTIAGAALAATGVGAPWAIGLGLGALETARTGDIGKGLTMGLGAFGGAGLAGMAGLGAAGAGAAATSTAGSAATPTANAMLAAPEVAGSTANMAGASNTLASGSVGAPTAGSFGSLTPGAAPGGIGNFGAANTGMGLSAGAAPVASTAAAGSSTIPATGANFAKYGMAAAAPAIAAASEIKPPAEEPEDPRYAGSPYKYNLSPDFQGYVPRQPKPYYRPTGLGYAEGGQVDPLEQMAPGGLAAIQGVRDGYAPPTTNYGEMPQFAEGGHLLPTMRMGEGIARDSDPNTAKLDPYEAALYRLKKTAGASKVPYAKPKEVTGLGDIQVGMAKAAGGSIGGYSDGGRMLKGPGDGMSDSIPGVIGNKQPARLADGEFVVPADVVSHLGNGSTDAGAKRLYSMMDKVRQARTGNKKQGKQIKPEKYMPA